MTDDKTQTTLSAPSRRNLLQTAGMGALAFGTAAATGIAATVPARAAGVTDADILNFALNLEYLEAEFYLRATTGHGLKPNEITGECPVGPTTGGSMVNFTDHRLMLAAQDIAKDEHTHVTFLRAALGSAKVAKPQIDFATSFTTLARAAGIVGPTGVFNPFADQNSFLIGAYIFEDVGVTAYHGAAPLIVNKAYLSAAAGILAVEAYHAGEIRSLIQRSPNAALAGYAAKVSALRAALSGANDDMGPVVDGEFVIAPTDDNSIAFARTTTQVLNIVYGGGAASNHLFFPFQMNGTIR